MTVLSIISISLGIILSAISIITLIKSGILKKTKEDNLIKEGVKSLLRSEILKFYYKCKEDKAIPQYQRECLDKLYEAYKALGGNSFIDDVYSEMREWAIIK